jgi:hypothetical protein
LPNHDVFSNILSNTPTSSLKLKQNLPTSSILNRVEKFEEKSNEKKNEIIEEKKENVKIDEDKDKSKDDIKIDEDKDKNKDEIIENKNNNLKWFLNFY